MRRARVGAGRRRGRDFGEAGRAGTFVLVGLLVFVLGAGVAAASVVWLETRVQRVEVEGIAPQGDLDGDGVVDPHVDEITEVLNVLLVGVDGREGLSEERQRELSTGTAEGVRTDTIMLLRLDPQEELVGLLSFPRDLLVTRCDGSRGRINAAYGVGEREGAGGPSCLVQTINELTGIPVHHYAEVDFDGFVEVVDTLGGITMGFDEPIFDERAGLDLPAGCVTLDGADALAFVRARYLDDDFGRIARQQRFVREVTREVTSAGTLLNVPRLFSLVDTAGQAVETDPDLSLRQMRRIAFTLRDLTEDELRTQTVPGDYERIDGILFLRADESAGDMFEAFRDGSLFAPDEDEADAADPTEAGTATPEPTVPVEEVGPIDVVNAAGVAGLAAAATDELEAEGFEIRTVRNGDEPDRESTLVLHPDGAQEAAAAVASALPDATLEAADVEVIVVELGADYAAHVEGADDRPFDPALLDPDAQPGYAGASTTLDC